MNKTKDVKPILMFYGIALVALAIIYIVIPFNHNWTFWASYLFALLSIVVGCAITCWAFAKDDNLESRFLSFPIFKLGIIYSLSQNAVSFLILIVGIWVPVPAWCSIVVSIILLAITGMGTIAREKAKEIIEDVQQKTKLQTRQIEYFNIDIGDIVNFCTDEEIIARLKKLADKIKYCDPVSIPETKEKEAEIAYEIDKLKVAIEKSDVESAFRLIDTISALIDSRSKIGQMCK